MEDEALFGVVDRDEDAPRLGRFAGRRFGDWGTAVASTINLITGIVNTVTHSNQGNTTGSQPGSYTASCPPGYVFNPSTGMCQLMQAGQPASGGLNIDPTVLAIGGGALVLVLLLATTGRK